MVFLNFWRFDSLQIWLNKNNFEVGILLKFLKVEIFERNEHKKVKWKRERAKKKQEYIKERKGEHKSERDRKIKEREKGERKITKKERKRGKYFRNNYKRDV